MDHAVHSVPDSGELVRERRVHARVVSVVAGEPHTDSGKELVVGDVLLLRTDDSPRDLELELLGEVAREQAHDAVVLSRHQRVRGGERDVLVGPHVTCFDPSAQVDVQRALQLHRRRGRRVASCSRRRQVAVRKHERRHVVSEVTVDRAVTEPLQPIVGPAVHRERVDVRADGVHLLTRVA